MAHGIEVKDRTRHFKKYRSCFTGGPKAGGVHTSMLAVPREADPIT